MLPAGVFAVGVGIVALVLIVVVSLRGPRDPGGRLDGHRGPLIPHPHDDAAGDDF